jgi:Myb-like DNA-binding protein FlbD
VPSHRPLRHRHVTIHLTQPILFPLLIRLRSPIALAFYCSKFHVPVFACPPFCESWRPARLTSSSVNNPARTFSQQHPAQLYQSASPSGALKSEFSTPVTAYTPSHRHTQGAITTLPPGQTTPLEPFIMVAHRRGPWSQHEDQWLVNLVTRNGPHNWVRISQEIGSRSPKQCRERYHQNLKPSLNHDPITAEEGELIEKMVAEMGKRWAEIARRLKGRSDNAVKNWWNGGQNRRKRNPERPDQSSREHMDPSQSGYSYSSARHSLSHHDEPHVQSYHNSRRPSLNPAMNSPHGLKLPQPPRFDAYPGSRPQPIDISAYGNPATARARGFETPMPSPSGYSIVSADGAPSLITDTGSESRSPRGAVSPVDITLAPLVGNRDDRKNSSTRYLPATGFAPEDDSYPTHFDGYRRRGSLQLPPLHRAEAHALSFQEPSYERPERPQLLTQPAPQLVHHHSLPHSAPASVPQRPLPAFHSLAEPTLPRPYPSSATASPATRQLPSPYARPALPSECKVAPVSPKDKMNLKNIM